MWLNLWNPAHKVTVYIKFPMATRWRDEQMMLSCYCASSLSHLCSLCVLPRDACTTANNMAPDSQSEARAPGWKVMGLLVASWMDFLKHRQFVPVGENKCLQRACVCVCFLFRWQHPLQCCIQCGPLIPDYRVFWSELQLQWVGRLFGEPQGPLGIGGHGVTTSLPALLFSLLLIFTMSDAIWSNKLCTAILLLHPHCTTTDCTILTTPALLHKEEIKKNTWDLSSPRSTSSDRSHFPEPSIVPTFRPFVPLV